MSTTTIDKSSERVQRMFGEIAPRYDRMNHLLSLNVDRYWRWWTVRKLAPVAGEPILDVCTGTGDLALAFQRATQGKSEIVAADFCREMLEIGRQKQARAKIGGELTFVEADAQNLLFEDNRFAIVSVAFGLRNLADTDRGLSEMTRVCRPSGQVAVLEFSTPRWQPFRGLYLWYFRNILPRIGQLFAKNSSAAYEYLPATVAEFPDGEALAERMRGVGLRNVKYWPLTGGIATLYVGRK
ncbi:MAG: bifunctional demethylmenaquinone methyltransferase/2-methoxy-6-polyprenyl-1,4-benzoquinol methylase UbiE [Planctomycetaceae bacterium]|nr:bifunctional demethylmenaquinone methyltransferase/2-methoxy-6-polyprenyl-1,4-benzoquinol methylase UbiE [Planctomycetaceae bacterium]